MRGCKKVPSGSGRTKRNFVNALVGEIVRNDLASLIKHVQSDVDSRDRNAVGRRGKAGGIRNSGVLQRDSSRASAVRALPPRKRLLTAPPDKRRGGIKNYASNKLNGRRDLSSDREVKRNTRNWRTDKFPGNIICQVYLTGKFTRLLYKSRRMVCG